MEYKFKIIILGDYSSGKTSIVKRIKDESFYETYSSTLGVDFLKKNYEHLDLFNDTMTFEDGNAAYEITTEDRLSNFKSKDSRFKKYHNILDKTRREDIIYSLAIWDTSGQEKFTTITTAYFRRVTGCVLVFDITNFSSFKSIKSWYSNLLNQIKESERAYFPLVLVGNKADLAKNRAVPAEEAIKLAETLGCSYIESSAKDNTKINEILAELVRNITFKINHELIYPSAENGICILNNDNDLFPKNEFKIDEEEGGIVRCCSIM